ncbi:AGAP010565-PA, partial [Anopheles gambiae str. PEST]|uniref:Uncharacterized protein n=2 Tax=gambiae species complex TaxID=44542 RepID=A0A6E8W0Q5_ANOCL
PIATEEECVALRVKGSGRCNDSNYRFGAAGDYDKRAGAGRRCGYTLDAVSRAGWTVYVGGGRRRRRIGRNRANGPVNQAVQHHHCHAQGRSGQQNNSPQRLTPQQDDFCSY